MFDFHTFSDHLINLSASRLGQTLGRIVVGVVGVLVLVGFLLVILSPEAVAALFPLLVAFNTALTGYGVIDKTRDRFAHKRLVAICAGGIVVVAATAAGNLLFWQMTGTTPIGPMKIWMLLPIGIGASWLGSALAIRYFKLR